MTALPAWVGLPPDQALILAAICFAAGLIRGFSGFGLSAVVMAAAALIVPPVQLIPMLLILEISASLLMIRNGFSRADKRLSFGLAITAAAGLPLGLWFTMTVSPDLSRLLALSLIIALALAQLAKVRMAFLATTPGLVASGLVSGITTGVSGAGGMVVALYVLAQDLPATRMRASLVLYLMASSCFSTVTHLALGTLDGVALTRGLVFAVPCLLGVMAGKLCFVPAWERFYKPFCLCLLVALAAAGLVRLTTG